MDCDVEIVLTKCGLDLNVQSSRARCDGLLFVLFGIESESKGGGGGAVGTPSIIAEDGNLIFEETLLVLKQITGCRSRRFGETSWQNNTTLSSVLDRVTDLCSKKAMVFNQIN